MITALMALYLQWVSIIGLLESANNYQVERSRVLDAIVTPCNPMITLEDKITQFDLVYRPQVATTTPYFDMDAGISTIEWYKNPYFSCPKCKSGQVQATMTPLGTEKEFVFDCHCEACQGKWRIKIPVIVEVIE